MPGGLLRMTSSRRSIFESSAARALLVAVTYAITLAVFANQGFALSPASPPVQPATGPGGAAADYIVGVAEEHGSMPTGYWLFEPGNTDGSPLTDPMPLVIFFHGYTAIDPELFRPWIDHIVKRGAIVIYPYYQNVDDNILPEFMENSETAIRNGLTEHTKPGHVPIDLKRVGVVGHSFGAVLTADYAAIAERDGLPVPTVMMPVEPGGCIDCNELPPGWGVPLEDFSNIPASVRAYIITGSDDSLVGDAGAKHVWNGMTRVPQKQKDYIIIQSDLHGSPLLFADHDFPVTGPLPERLNALDWFGTWKLFDLLTDCGFADKGCDQAFGGTKAQTDMGVWNDGTPVAPAVIDNNPGV